MLNEDLLKKWGYQSIPTLVKFFQKWGYNLFESQYMKYTYAHYQTCNLFYYEFNKYLKLFRSYGKIIQKFAPDLELDLLGIMQVFHEYMINKEDPKNLLNLSFARKFMSIKGNRESIKIKKIYHRIQSKIIKTKNQTDQQYKHMVASKFITSPQLSNDENENIIKDIKQIYQKIKQLQLQTKQKQLDILKLTQQQQLLLFFNQKIQKLIVKQQQKQNSITKSIDKLILQYKSVLHENYLQSLKLESSKNKKQNNELIQLIKQDLLKMEVQGESQKQSIQQQVLE